MTQEISKCTLKGSIQIPASKSDGQRAILCAALSEGTSLLKNVGRSDDEKAMLQHVNGKIAKINKLHEGLQFTKLNAIDLPREINCGESGLGLRLVTPVFASLNDNPKTITGHGSLLKRKHEFFGNHLPEMGVNFTSNDDALPFEMSGTIQAGNYTVDGGQSSQYISGLIIALARAEGDSVLNVENPSSMPYIDMTLKTMRSFGVNITHSEDYTKFNIQGGQAFTGTTYTIEGDWSSASYWLTAAAIGHPVVIKGLDLESPQADRAFLKALENAQCKIEITDDEICIDGSQRKGFEFDATHCPDLFPALVCLAAFCEGTSKFEGVNRLANKESDRGLVLQEEFGKLGLEIQIDGDLMTVTPNSNLQGTLVSSHNDHRIAMCLAIAGSRIDGTTTISGAEAVSKSYPQFWEHLERLK